MRWNPGQDFLGSLYVNLVAGALPPAQHLDQRVLYSPLSCHCCGANPKAVTSVVPAVYSEGIQSHSHSLDEELKMTILESKQWSQNHPPYNRLYQQDRDWAEVIICSSQKNVNSWEWNSFRLLQMNSHDSGILAIVYSHIIHCQLTGSVITMYQRWCNLTHSEEIKECNTAWCSQMMLHLSTITPLTVAELLESSVDKLICIQWTLLS